MSVQRVAVALAVTTLGLVACGDDDRTTPPPSSGGPSGGQGGEATGGGGAGPGGGGGEGAYLGDIPVVEEPDTPCSATTAVPVEILPARSEAGLDRLFRVGSRWAASGGLGFLTFDDAGGTPTALTGLAEDAAHFADAAGGTLGIAGFDDLLDPAQMTFARYDPSGVALVAAQPLGRSDSVGSLVAESAEGSLVAWYLAGDPRLGEPQGLVASFIDPAGLASAPFELSQTGIDAAFTGSAVATPSGFALGWSIGSLERSESYFLAATSAAPTGAAVPIALSEGRHRLIRLVRTDSGFAALMQGGLPFEAAFVVFLDEAGAVVPPAHQYLGATNVIDLAVGDGGLGLVALRADDVPAFRPLDASGVPSGPWVCFDGVSELVGIAADSAGWALVRQLADESADFLRVDATGSTN